MLKRARLQLCEKAGRFDSSSDMLNKDVTDVFALVPLFYVELPRRSFQLTRAGRLHLLSATLDRASMSPLLNDYAASWSWQLEATKFKVQLQSKNKLTRRSGSVPHSLDDCISYFRNTGSSVHICSPFHRSHVNDFVEPVASLGDARVPMKNLWRVRSSVPKKNQRQCASCWSGH